MLSDLPMPTLHKKITCAMLTHSPRATLHRKIICNVILISVGQHWARTLPVQCCVFQAMTKLHRNIAYSVLPKYI